MSNIVIGFMSSIKMKLRCVSILSGQLHYTKRCLFSCLFLIVVPVQAPSSLQYVFSADAIADFSADSFGDHCNDEFGIS